MDGKWIKLEEQNRRFALNERNPAAGELQINGKNIIFRGNNIKPGIAYKLFLLGRKRGNSVYKIIGDIVPDREGTVNFQCTVNPADIDGEGTDLSCFYIFMVAAMGRPLQPVLKGDLVKLQDAGKTGGNKPARQNGHRESDSNLKIYNGYYSQYILEKIAVLETEPVEFVLISPFDDTWLLDNWRRTADPSLLPVASAGAERQIRKYGHFIFGNTEKHFYLGVPGRHTGEEWPDGGRSGFMLWQSIRKSAEYGYWAMVIDRKTGIITEIS